MKILLVHNYYQLPGGEDVVYEAEAHLFEAYGHKVVRHNVHNDQTRSMGSLALGVATIWNNVIYRELRSLFRRERPQVVHFHNTFPLISPAAYYAAGAEGVPVVQTLHNYRLFCPNALFFREDAVCEDCLGKAVPWPGIMRGCYRGSRAATAAVATMLVIHRLLRTWMRKVNVYIALTEFARQKFIEGGLPADRIVVKPNFVYPDPGKGYGQGRYALFVGRLSPEKGIDVLLSAWEHLGGKIPLRIVGDGPLAPRVQQAAQTMPGVEWLGRKAHDEVLSLMKDANVLIFPSVWYEGFPMTITEAYATGLPVVASDLGSMSSLIDHGRTGLRFRVGDPEDLASKVEWVLAHPNQLAEMRDEARMEYETKYTAEQNYEMLMEIYQLAINRAKGRH